MLRKLNLLFNKEKTFYDTGLKFISTSTKTTEETSLVENANPKKTYKIIPVQINEALMPYSKTIRIQATEEIKNLLRQQKPEDSEYCVFFNDKKKNQVSNIGIRCTSIQLISNGEEISITSKEKDSRVFANVEDKFFDQSRNEEPLLSDTNTLTTRNAVEYVDQKEVSSMMIDVEIAKNLIADINKVIYSFHDITSKKTIVDHSAMRDINSAIIFLQNILKINMDFILNSNEIIITEEEILDDDKENESLYNLLNSRSAPNSEQGKINEFIQQSRSERSKSKSKLKTKDEYLIEVNSLLFENIQEFLRLSKSFYKSVNFKSAYNFLFIQDPILRTKALTELIYEIGDYLIKDLFMLDEYKKDSIQKQEKYMLRFVKKQVEKYSSGENADSYIKKLAKLYSNGDISEQVKRSIQLEIDLAFHSGSQNFEAEMEDRKKYIILEEIFNFPWEKRQEVVYDVEYTNSILNSELFGLNKVKQRIDEYIAKLKRKNSYFLKEENGSGSVNKSKGFVILITGPPGTGKTTVAQLIGKALKRKTGIINLSGETDTINLKGSRRTYVDSQPSIFFKEMVKLGVKNPVIILDEIDKIANKGDKVSHSASSALLELLNPEENHNFIDQYLNIPLDFSETIFICTSNYNVNLLEPLLDRVEILEIDDYTFKEKKIIAEKFLIPKTLSEYGLSKYNNENTLISPLSMPDIIFPESSIEELIKDYSYSGTGVRSIKRSIEKLIRKVNMDILRDNTINKITIDQNILLKHLGKHKIADDNMLKIIKGNARYLYADYYGNIGKIIMKKRSLSVCDDISKLNDLLKELTVKDIFSNLHLLTKLSKPVKEALDISINLARKTILELIEKGVPFDHINLLTPYSLYMTYPYQEKVGNGFGLSLYLYLIQTIFDFHPSMENQLILGEVNPKGNILKISHLKYILASCEYYNVDKLILPEGNRQEYLSFIKNSDKKIMANFVSTIDEAYNIVFSDNLSKIKAIEAPTREEIEINNMI